MKICVFTFIKNEHEYLEDWLKYNINLGIDKIYIVEDIDSESHKDITDKYLDNVEILNIPYDHDESVKLHKPTKQAYYQEKMFRYIKSLNMFDWCFMLDIDEYITITENISLKSLLNEYSNYVELLIYWKNFGANLHIEKPDYSVVNSYREYYTKEGNYSNCDSKHTMIMKKAINLNRISDKYRIAIHYYTTSNYIKTNFEKGMRVPCFDRMYLSHYITRSWEEYIWKLLVRGMCCTGHRKIDDFFEINPELNDSRDKMEKMIPDIIAKYTKDKLISLCSPVSSC